MKKFLSMITLLSILTSWQNVQERAINQTAWLIGTWESKTKNGSLFETWSKAGEMEMAGKSYVRKGNDTLVFETIQLIQKPMGLFYIPTVKNQNAGRPVSFKLKEVSAESFAFENPAHDFPQFIRYTRIGPDSLVAEISGKRNGKERIERFPMKRVEK